MNTTPPTPGRHKGDCSNENVRTSAETTRIHLQKIDSLHLQFTHIADAPHDDGGHAGRVTLPIPDSQFPFPSKGEDALATSNPGLLLSWSRASATGALQSADFADETEERGYLALGRGALDVRNGERRGRGVLPEYHLVAMNFDAADALLRAEDAQLREAH